MAATEDNRLRGSPRLVFHPQGRPLVQIPDEIRKCVAFLACKRNSGMEARGTVFFVGITVTTEGDTLWYAVTARHVIEKIEKLGIDGASYFRLNHKELGAVLVAHPLSRWIMAEDSRVDVAISPVHMDCTVYDHKCIPESMLLTDEQIAHEAIGAGDDLFFPGLFAHHPGKKENIPIIRVGNIAAMPGERIQTEWGHIRAYLAEARSIGGLSGSPVLVNTRGTRTRGGKVDIFGGQHYLLGLVHGHFGMKDVLDCVEEAPTDDSFSRSVNMGIAIVIPADDIRAVLDQPQVVESRNAKVREFLAAQSKNLPEAD